MRERYITEGHIFIVLFELSGYGDVKPLRLPLVRAGVQHLRRVSPDTVTVRLGDEVPIQGITEVLEKLHAPALQDVTVQFRIVDRTLIYPRHDADYIDACLRFDAALSKFPRHRLSLLVSSEFRVRKHLCTRELGQLFPTLRDLGRLTINCESSERLDPSISSI